MGNELTNPTFDYAPLSKDEKGKLIWFEGELTRSRKRVAAELIKHGDILHGAQQLLANHSGGIFQVWLASVGISHGSAYRAIDVYLEFGSCSNWNDLEVSAAYVLAKNQKAKTKALKLLEKGIKVTHAIAKQLIAAVTPPPPSSGGSPPKPAPPEAPESPVTAAGPDWPDELPTAAKGQGGASAARQPPKKLDRGAYYQQWDNAIGPLVRLVDKIAEGLAERCDPHQVAIQERLNEATEEMVVWMGVE